MHALLCTEFGTPPTLVSSEVPEVPLGSGEVRVATGAVGLGFFDVVFLGGKYQERPTLPAIAGREVAGRIVEVGPGIDPSVVGRMVAAISYSGAFAERSVVREASCIYVPDDMPATSAACLPSPYATALYALQNCAALRPGERVLILGAAGTVGIGAIHVARALGGRPIAMASSESKRAYCLSQGAEAAIDGTDPDWRSALEAAAGKVDVVLDPVGGSLSERAFRCLAPGGRHLVVGFASGEIPQLPLNLCLLKRASAIGVDLRGYTRDDPVGGRALMDEVGELVASGAIRPQPGTIHSLDTVGDALAELAAGRTMGKPVVQLDTWNS